MGTQTLADYIRKFGKMSKEDFAVQLSSPVLVEIGVHQDLATADKKKESFHTDFVNAQEAMARYLTPNTREVFVIEKRADAVFSGHISVGRTPNLDICIARTGVSKFHAHFMRGPDGVYTVTDKESRNGTFVDGKRVPSGCAVPIEDAAQVRFGSHSFRFMLPEPFRQFLQSLLVSKH